MRLLHTDFLSLRDFFDDDIPKYAILSHRWSDEEVTYQDFLAHSREEFENVTEGYGWIKICEACKLAREYPDGPLDWIWIDTCCIDKSSSAELSEGTATNAEGATFVLTPGVAINSMYRWYEHADICFVFLPDVHNTYQFHPPDNTVFTLPHDAVTSPSDNTLSTLPHASRRSTAPFNPVEFEKSTWFRRAWTLQELLAPRFVDFYNAEFKCIGTKQGLADVIAEASDIPVMVLRGESSPIESIANRMNWAAKRRSSRGEDEAYSLLGIFGVNMPLLYGEGAINAFVRLQKEIIASSPYESIFCWASPSSETFIHALRDEDMLARRVSYFARDKDVTYWPEIKPPYEITSRGLHTEVYVSSEDITAHGLGRAGKSECPGQFVLPLNCWKGGRDSMDTVRRPVGQYALLINCIYSRSATGLKILTLHGCRKGDILIKDYKAETSTSTWHSTKISTLDFGSCPVARPFPDDDQDVLCKLYLHI